MTTSALVLPDRYLPIACLGQGGGGAVWSVRDRHAGTLAALKVLASDASEREMAALVREAVALSGLEGLGVPRVLAFGRLVDGRPYMVRELVEGQSLQELIEAGTEPMAALEALARAADQLTVVHRSGLLHGDFKPANVIVTPGGSATLVDLGLAAPWREQGTQPEGLTPRYAAPELFQGRPLTVRAEIYALGVALIEALEATEKIAKTARERLEAVAARATESEPSKRFPSADEFAAALRHAAGVGSASGPQEEVTLWPIVGTDATANSLLDAVRKLPRGSCLRVMGPPGSGRSALLRRTAWSLGIEGKPLRWLDEHIAAAPSAVETELGTVDEFAGLTLLVDDADALAEAAWKALESALTAGAKLVVAGGERLGNTAALFEIPPLDASAAADLVRRAIPSLTDSLVDRVVQVSGCRPGELRRVVRALASEAIASQDDIESLLSEEGIVARELPEDPLQRATYFLDRGRYNDARAVLETLDEGDPLGVALARARLCIGLGEAARALELLRAVEKRARSSEDSDAGRTWRLILARAQFGMGEYEQTLALTQPLLDDSGALGSEALAFRGAALSFLGRHDEARADMQKAVERARAAGQPRAEAVALACLGVAYQRADHADDAKDAYQNGVAAAERAGDAGMLATLQLNLAGLLKMQGDIAGAIERFEAALDMGKRSGRRSTMRQALLNLANTDLYLGRLARARSSIEFLGAEKDALPPTQVAQYLGLRAELEAKQGALAESEASYEESARAYEALARYHDAAEARLEGILLASRADVPDVVALRSRFDAASAHLGDSAVHRPLAALCAARIAWLADDESRARARIDEALAASREGGQREWLWRALESRAELEEDGGQPMRARRDREEALAVLEGIAERLPRDLREVYWNDPRRRALRNSVQGELSVAPTAHAPLGILPHPPVGKTLRAGGRTSVSGLTVTPLEQRLARLLEVNAELAGELDLGRLTARITDYAVELSRAERGFVLLLEADGSLSVHASHDRAGDEHAEFSRSIARTVVTKGEPIVSLSAQSDARLQGYASVHQLMLSSVACVPICAPNGEAIGALYVETRTRSAGHFENELPMLRAFADQVAIAIETARLIGENKRRADELSQTNAELEEAQERLRELLGDRTKKLNAARRKLRDARDTLYSHFGYQGLVGTSDAMRRVYALIDRVKDTDVPILITGESGTGKEVVARAIHNASQRSKKRFLGVNCGAIPENLLESELFGNVKGAFTGADRERKGLLREGEGGTVLLDEIGEMPQKMQAGLLRVLQERTVRPVGGTQEEPVDIRLIFATNRELEAMVKQGTFREDLYYRIHVVEVALPALRDRVEDIPQLVDYFLGIFSARYKREKGVVSRAAMRRLAAFAWPGNVRQLEHVLLNAWVLSETAELNVEDLDIPDAMQQQMRERRLSERPPPPSSTAAPPSSTRTAPKSTVSSHRRDERERILKALQACNWNRVKAAQLVGIPRRTFYRRLKEHGIQ
ncbi:MAG: sigma 54-interacting transcriptional regulator [Polyangiaceae bacterium]